MVRKVVYIEKPPNEMSAYTTHTLAVQVLKPLLRTFALNYQECLSMLGRTHPLPHRSRGCDLGVVKEQVDG